jgi:outer membrane protein TolC
MSTTTILRGAAAATVALLLAGCASGNPQAALIEVDALVRDRAGAGVAWYPDDNARSVDDPRVRELLAGTLTAEAALEVALLRNAAVQGSLAELGIAEAGVDQAGRPPNPTLSLARLASGVEIEIEKQILVNVLSFLTMKQRIAIAESDAQRTRYVVALEIASLTDRVRRAWIEAVGARERAAIMETVFEKTKIAADMAQRLATTGITSALDQTRVQTANAETAANLARAKLAAQTSREKLIREMGLWGRETAIRLPEKLPDLPKKSPPATDYEREAIAKRLDLEAARIAIETLALQLGLTERTSVISLLELSGLGKKATEIESGHTTITRGLELEISVPLFDWGKAKVEKAEWTYRQALERLRAMAVSARSEVREAYVTSRGLLDIARHLHKEVLPLRQRIADEELLRYNGMLVGTFELITASRQVSEATMSAVDAKRDFWLAKMQLDFALLTGKGQGPAVSGGAMASADDGGGGH